MQKITARFVALLLIPALLVDPAMSSIMSHAPCVKRDLLRNSRCLFAKEAVVPPSAMPLPPMNPADEAKVVHDYKYLRGPTGTAPTSGVKPNQAATHVVSHLPDALTQLRKLPPVVPSASIGRPFIPLLRAKNLRGLQEEDFYQNVPGAISPDEELLWFLSHATHFDLFAAGVPHAQAVMGARHLGGREKEFKSFADLTQRIEGFLKKDAHARNVHSYLALAPVCVYEIVHQTDRSVIGRVLHPNAVSVLVQVLQDPGAPFDTWARIIGRDMRMAHSFSARAYSHRHEWHDLDSLSRAFRLKKDFFAFVRAVLRSEPFLRAYSHRFAVPAPNLPSILDRGNSPERIERCGRAA